MLGRRIETSLLLVVAAMLWTSCGSSGHTGVLTAAQARAISQEVVHAVVVSLPSVQSLSPAPGEQSSGRLAAALDDLHPEQSSPGCTSTPNGQSCNFPLSGSDPCSGGGSISVTGDILGTLNNSGTGSLAAQLTVSPTSCSLPSVTFNGNPDITIAGNINFTSAGPMFPVSLMEEAVSRMAQIRQEPVVSTSPTRSIL